MKVNPVHAMVVAVLFASTVKCGEAIDSEELCEQIRSNKLGILTMGVRGRSHEDAHFYILVEGGYMFKVPLTNLRVDAANRTTSITIDREYIRADALLNVSQDLFTRQNRFFLISNQNQDAFLGRMFFCQEHSQRAFQLYDLNGALPIWNHSQDIYDQSNLSIHVMASVGIDSSIAHGFGLFGIFHLLQFSYEVHNKDELKEKKSQNLGRYMIEFQNNSETVTVFYHQENPKKRFAKEDGYYYFLEANGRVTVSRRKNASDFASSYGKMKDLYKDSFEANLSSFVVCHFKQTANTRINWTYWIIALCIGIFAVLGGLAIYFYVGMKKEKAKRRDLKKKNRQNKSNLSSLASSNLSSSNVNSSSISSGTSSSNASSNAFTLTSNPTTSSSSMASKASGVLQSVKSGISSLLSRNKSKQAKTVVKAKNSKAKSNKPKSPK